MRLLKILLGVSAVLTGVPAHASSSDVRANDAMQLFSAFCIRTDGDRSNALSVLGQGNALATRLPDNVVSSLQAGRSGGVAWAIASPNKAQLLLEYVAGGICGIRIADADEASVQAAFDELVRQAAAGEKITAPEAQITEENGVRRTYRTYAVARNGKTAAFALSTTDKRAGAQQHLMTFGYVAP